MSARTEHIVVVSHGFQQSYEMGFVNGVAMNGIQVTLIGSDETDLTRLHPSVNVLNLRGSQTSNRSRVRKAVNLLVYHLRLLLWVIRYRPTVVHIIGLFRYPLLMGVLETWLMRVFSGQLVLTVHNLLPHNRHTRLNRWIHWLVYRIPDCLIVHTIKMQKDLIKQFGMRCPNIVVMEHGVNDPCGLEEEPQVLIPGTGTVSEGRVRLLCFGVISRYKGVDLLVQAMDILPRDFALKIVGICVDDQFGLELERLIKNSVGGRRIEWRREFVREKEIPGLFLSADAVVLPYRHIDQSGVLFKALDMGCPVIATDVGTLKDYVNDKVGIICDSVSVPGLVNALLEFSKNRNRFSRNAIRQHSKQYLWSTTCRVILDLYRFT